MVMEEEIKWAVILWRISCTLLTISPSGEAVRERTYNLSNKHLNTLLYNDYKEQLKVWWLVDLMDFERHIYFKITS